MIKRDVLEGDKAEAARKKMTKAAGKMLRIRKGPGEEVTSEKTAPVASPEKPPAATVSEET